MAQIVTITNPLTGQPAQVDQLEHTAQEIDDSIGRALPGGEIDTLLAGKAPAGYGLGGNAAAPTTNDADSCTLTGWYAISSMSNCPFTYGLLRVEKWYDGCIFQTAYEMSSGVVVQRRYQNSEWKPWEYVNPPVNSTGIEYRTTERFFGLPVYVKVIDIGSLPNKTMKSISNYAENVEYVIDFDGFSYYYGQSLRNSDFARMYARSTSITVETFSDLSSGTAIMWVKYTKTTD